MSSSGMARWLRSPFINPDVGAGLRPAQENFIVNEPEASMQQRRFGRTGHMSTVAIFGAAAFWEIDQAKADEVLELLLEHGVNHIDVAPSYGQAEERVGPWLKRMRERFFLGCKTTERTKEGAAAEMRR